MYLLSMHILATRILHWPALKLVHGKDATYALKRRPTNLKELQGKVTIERLFYQNFRLLNRCYSLFYHDRNGDFFCMLRVFSTA